MSKINYAKTINNENILAENLTAKEMLAVENFISLRKAIKSSRYDIIFDCNYSKSRKVKNDLYLVDYYHLYDRASDKSLANIYLRIDNSLDIRNIKYQLYTTCNSSDIDTLISYDFNVKYNKDKTKILNSEKKCSQLDIVDTLKLYIAIINKEIDEKD